MTPILSLGTLLLASSCILVNVQEEQDPGVVVYTGIETLTYAWDHAEPGGTDCVLEWDVTGRRSQFESKCPNCEWVFDMELTYNRLQSDDNGACEEAGLTEDFEWVYGFVPSYFGDEALMIYVEDDNEWRPWIYEGQGDDALAYGVQMDTATGMSSGSAGYFTYSGGWDSVQYYGGDEKNDAYVGNYFTVFWAGEGQGDW